MRARRTPEGLNVTTRRAETVAGISVLELRPGRSFFESTLKEPKDLSFRSSPETITSMISVRTASTMPADSKPALDRTFRVLSPLSLSALLLTLVLLFGLQGEQIIRQPLVIGLLAVPILIQVYFNAGLAYGLNRLLGVEWCVAGPPTLIGASNFFELAVATAIALFGFQSGAALATVVGVLVEVPVMLSVVHIVRRSRGWYERGMVE